MRPLEYEECNGSIDAAIELLNELRKNFGGSRELALAITKMEEAQMWFDKEMKRAAS